MMHPCINVNDSGQIIHFQLLLFCGLSFSGDVNSASPIMVFSVRLLLFLLFLIFTLDSIYAVAHICYRLSVYLSVRPSVTRVDQS